MTNKFLEACTNTKRKYYTRVKEIRQEIILRNESNGRRILLKKDTLAVLRSI